MKRSGMVLVALAVGTQAPGVATGQEGPQSEPMFASRLWTAEHGLPMNQVVDIAQTEDGYLWVATFGGIARFDGLRFVVYDAADHPGLPSSRFQAIEVAPDGAIIGLTEFGQVVRLFRERFEVLVPGPHLEGDVATGMWTDRDGRVWVGTAGDIGAVDGDSLVAAFPSPPGWRVTVALEAFDRQWIGDQDGQLHALGADGTRTLGPLPDGGRLGFWSQISALAEGPDGGLYVGTFGGLVRLNPDTYEAERLSGVGVDGLTLSPDGSRMVASGGVALEIDHGGNVTRLAEGTGADRPQAALWTRDGALWIGHERTVFREGVPVYEAPSAVDELFQDSEGSVWVGGPGGLTQLTRTAFTTHAPPDSLLEVVCRGQTACLAGFGVYAIAEAPGDPELWVGTLHHGTWRLGGDGTFRVVGAAGAITLTAERGEVLRGGYRTGLCRFRGSDCVATPWVGSIVRALAYDADGTLWVGSNEGLTRVDGDGTTHFGRAEGLPHEHVFSVVAVPDGPIWIGTLDGIARLEGGRIESLGSDDGLDAGAVRFLRWSDRVLWVGTESRGLFRIDVGEGALADAHVTRFGTHNGLYSDGIHTMLDDGRGRMWMSSNQGIFWVPQSALDAVAEDRADRVRSVAYLERDGLTNREANGGSTSAGLRASDGRLWFATMGGAAVVDPSGLELDRPPPRVVVEAVRTGTDVLDSHQDIVLPSDRRDFSIEYTAPSFLGAASLPFRYRLDGYDPDWVDAGTRRTAFYTNVPAGHHTFRVAVAGADGSWHEVERPIVIEVSPLPHEQPWFLPLVALMVLSGGLLVLRRRERLHGARTLELSGLVRERTALLEAEKEQSERARAVAERAEATAQEALAKVADQAHRLQELDRAKSRFFANISHELRTPLTLTIGPLEDLRDGMHGDIEPGAREEIDLALRNSNRLLRMVNQLLDIAKLEAGHLELRPAQVDLAQLVASVLQAFTPLAERRSIGFSSGGLDRPLLAIVDPDQYEKIVVNLLSNAFKFTDPGASVHVRLAESERAAGDSEGGQPEAWAILSVIDTGVGIPAHLHAQIFERFYQVGERAEARSAGTGIGLSLVREFVDLHGGRIVVESAPGEGSTFTVEVPTNRLEAVGEAGPRETTSAMAVGAPDLPKEGLEDEADDDFDPRLTILVVDDNPEIRHYVGKHLSERYRVLEASDGGSGLEMARRHIPDLVLSDVMMPNMTGDELCRAIKSDPDLEFVPVILLTAKASEDSRIRGLEVGADDYLTKPFSMQELQARIGNLVRRRQRLRERLRKAEIVSTGATPDATSPDELFLAGVRRTILEHLGDEDFGVEALAEALGHSRAHLYRRLGELEDRSPAKLIRLMRLERGAELLQEGAGTVGAVAYAVGFKSVSHFSHAFRERYGVTPSQFARGVTPRER